VKRIVCGAPHHSHPFYPLVLPLLLLLLLLKTRRSLMLVQLQA
jgi:hypothetical protein